MKSTEVFRISVNCLAGVKSRPGKTDGKRNTSQEIFYDWPWFTLSSQRLLFSYQR